MESGKPANKLVIVTGPESTAKSSISQFLAKSCGCSLIEEYARAYILKHPNYTYKHVKHIAEKQIAELKATIKKNRPVIVDTYLIITKVWMVWKYKSYPKWMDKAIAETQEALYLLCSPDIKWETDVVRENGGNGRIILFNLYQKELDAFGLNYEIIAGEGKKRTLLAKQKVDAYLKK